MIEANIKLFIDLKNLDENRIAIVMDINSNKDNNYCINNCKRYLNSSTFFFNIVIKT